MHYPPQKGKLALVSCVKCAISYLVSLLVATGSRSCMGASYAQLAGQGVLLYASVHVIAISNNILGELSTW